MDFQAPYNRTNYIDFLRNTLLPEDFEKADESIRLEFKPQYIRQVTKIGHSPSLEMNVYEVEHGSENDPRVSLSKESFRLLAEHGQKRALVLFISKTPNYRFSLVTVDLELEGKKVKREYSNPKRFSFFLGRDAKVHTPQQYLEKRVKDFEDLKQRFSIEVVNKDFYTEIAILFSKLTGGERKVRSRIYDFGEGTLEFPSIDKNIKKEFAVRLIGRLVFCWFLKKKRSKQEIPLLPEELLSTEAVNKNNGYYHNVLEPLFFEVLNTPIAERAKNFATKPWLIIPFLNGGLFTPHEDDYYGSNEQQKSQFTNMLKIPDNWLRDLLGVFETYNFTIDENTPVDIELAIEPEMLGRIFENLLAEINPETGETARKSTGSYYTPRPIVEYMVDESLKQYLLTKTGIDEEKISSLLSYSEEDAKGLNEQQKDTVLDALDTIKIIDPACGSGAFPMGILQKILLILQKIDPDSKKWLDKILSKVTDPTAKKAIEKKLRRETLQYIHKLGIIRDAIYGVDIQSIAVEISKLRCFLSLIVDETVDDTQMNRGVEPLPNLEFKFVCANTLISLPKQNKQQTMFEDKDSIGELKKLRDEYLNSYGREKKTIEERFRKVQTKMFEHSINWANHETQTSKLSQWDPFSFESNAWFDTEWMFGIKDGFDIAIANPPYDVTADKTLKAIYAEIIFGRPNVYLFFIYRAIHLLNKTGLLTFINPRTLLADAYCSGLRKWLIRNTSVISMMNIIERKNVFESVLQSVIVNIFSKDCTLKKVKVKNIRTKEDIYNEKDLLIEKENMLYGEKDDPKLILAGSSQAYSIFKKLSNYNSFSQNSIKFTTGKIQWDLYANVLSGNRDKNSILLIYAESIQRYYFRSPRKRASQIYLNKKLDVPPIQNKTIVVQRTTAVEQPFRIIAHIINPKDFELPILTENGTSLIETFPLTFDPYYVLSLLNSKLYDFIFRHINSNTHVSAGELNSLPLPKISIEKEKPMIETVDKILAITKDDDYLENPAKQVRVKELEKQIDQMVYNLYGLTPDEIAIVENSS